MISVENCQAKNDAIVELVMNARLWQRCFVQAPSTMTEGFGIISNSVQQVSEETDGDNIIAACKVVVSLMVACEQFMYTLPITDELDAVLIDVLKNGWPIGNAS